MPSPALGTNATTPDRVEALRRLERAGAVVRRHAELRHQLKRGELDPREVLADPAAFGVGSMRVYRFLISCPRIARTRAERLMYEARIAPSRRLRGLNERQRKRLAVLLTRRAKREREPERPLPTPPRARPPGPPLVRGYQRDHE